MKLSNEQCWPCKGTGWKSYPSTNLMTMVHRKCGWCHGTGKAQHVWIAEDNAAEAARKK